MFKQLCAIALVLLAPTLAAAGPITSLYVFGDSLSDSGNAYALTGGFPPAPYAQRASNGPVAVEQLASVLGITLAPSALGGTNYAVVGATTGAVTVPGSNPPVTIENVAAGPYGQQALANTSIRSQLLDFLLTGPIIDPDSALFVVWGGANDLSTNPSLAGAATAIGNLTNAVATLYGAGARQFLIPNLPDLSRTPSGLGLPPQQRAALQALTAAFNGGLFNAVSGLSTLPDIDIIPFDTFTLFNAIVASPSSFGFSNATNPCLTGTVFLDAAICSDPSAYVFWDALHPTTAAHRVLGNAFAATVVPEPPAVVPEPATLSLLALGLGVATAVQRRRAA